MDLKQLLDEHGPKLVSELTHKAGFQPDEAQKFVPAAAQQAFDKLKGGGLDLKSLLGGGDVSALIGKMDLGALAKTSGVDVGKAASGLKALLPALLELLKSKGFDAGKLASLLGGASGSGAGGIGGAIQGVGKLFGKG